VHYDGLPTNYRQQLRDRVMRTAERVFRRSAATAVGRVVPGDDDLVIGTGRVLELAVLFLDISGFSGRPSASPNEQRAVLQALNVFFSEMVRIATDYGGTVEKNTGDGLMAYFERVPGPGGANAPQRAVAAALTMMHANANVISPVLRSTGLVPLNFRVGIDYGHVTVARLGAARQFNANVAIGTPANVASKILAHARAGDIVIGESVAVRLPAKWLQWVEFHGPSEFQYLSDGRPYPLYRYIGRWV